VDITPEVIANAYKAAMDSVELINNGTKPDGWTDEMWADCIDRNKRSLRLFLEKDWWTTEDLEPLRQAAA
jgi:hypothetical protein